jgi:cytidylate kinase
MIIQVVGLPCSGKSTAIKNISNKFKIDHIDSQNLLPFHTLKDLKKEIKKAKSSVLIIESACGYNLPESTVVLIKVSSKRLFLNKAARKYQTTVEDESQIFDNICPANYTTYSVKDLQKLLATLIRK